MSTNKSIKGSGKDLLSGGADSFRTRLPLVLLKPEFSKDKTMLKALQQRKTIREVSDKKLSLQMLSNLLWAACGVNRKKGPFGNPGITAASASSSQEIDIYVAMEDGTWLYDAFHHKLIPVVAGDLRRLAIGRGQVGFGDKAPVRLIYVADIHRLSHTAGYQEPGLQDPEIQKSYYFVDTGMIGANVYLFAASQGLASWFHNCDKEALTVKLNLRPDQRILFGHTVGYPS
jgi:hypothetical protein